MKPAVLFLFLLLQEPGLRELRGLLPLVGESEAHARALIALSDKVRTGTTASAYKAVATMALAKYEFSPVKKLQHFRQGRLMLEACVNSDTLSPEPRFLRLAIQQNLPRVLNYNHAVHKDRRFLRAQLPSLTGSDPQLASLIAAYLSH